MSWYIDGWMWRDGLAFISEREEGELPSGTTVHVSSPWFDAVPVGNPSTALWGTRGHFEELLLDDDDNEIGFDSLAQAIEFVRRAYIAGGRINDGNPAPTEQNPRTPIGQGGATVEPEEWEEMKRLLPELTAPKDRERLIRMIERLWDGSSVAFEKFLSSMTEHLVESFGNHAHSDDPIRRAVRVRQWVRALVSSGFVPSDSFGGLTQPASVEENQPERMLEGVFEIPIPVEWRQRPDMVTIEDALRIFLSDRLLSEKDLSFSGFVPLLIAAKFVAVSASPAPLGTLGFANDNLHAALVREAATWLASQLPGTELKGHPAERVISQLAESVSASLLEQPSTLHAQMNYSTSSAHESDESEGNLNPA